MTVAADKASIPTTLQTTLTPSTHKDIPVSTEIVLQLFSDKIFILITQLNGKLGSLLQCTYEHSMIDNSKTYHISTLLGGAGRSSSDSGDVFNVYIRQITERIVALGDGRECVPILLGIALRKKNIHNSSNSTTKNTSVYNGDDLIMFRCIVDQVVKLYQEAIQITSHSLGNEITGEMERVD